MKAILLLIVGVLIGIGAYRYFSQSKPKPALDEVREDARKGATNVARTLKETFDTEKIKDELARTGRVVREKAKQAGEAIADAAADTRITASIKGKLLKESALTALQIDVDTTAGIVTLSGTVPSYDAIEKALDLALQTEGVHRVISTLQVKSE